jgi:hypothetical protein
MVIKSIPSILESLYRGRYKIKSVDNILRDWQRLGKPCHKFTPEFEREILQNLPAIIDLAANPLLPTGSSPVVSPESEQEDRSDPQFPIIQPAVHDSKNLNPEESAPFQHHNHVISAARSPNTQVEIVQRLEVPNLETYHPIGNSHVNQSTLFGSILQGRNSSKEKENSNVIANRLISPPAKFHLFNTLKAIVDPKNQQKAEVANSVGLPSIENQNHHRMAKFKLPLENSEEQHV